MLPTTTSAADGRRRACAFSMLAAPAAWKHFRHARQQALEIRRRGVDRHTVAQARDTTKVERRRFGFRRIELERQPQRRLGVRKLETPRHDADDRARHAVDRDRPAQDRRIGVEARFPEALANDDGGRRAGAIVILAEPAAHERRRSEHTKETRARERGERTVRGPASSLRRNGEVDCSGTIRRHSREDMVVARVQEKRGVRDRQRAGRRRCEMGQLPAIVGQRPGGTFTIVTRRAVAIPSVSVDVAASVKAGTRRRRRAACRSCSTTRVGVASAHRVRSIRLDLGVQNRGMITCPPREKSETTIDVHVVQDAVDGPDLSARAESHTATDCRRAVGLRRPQRVASIVQILTTLAHCCWRSGSPTLCSIRPRSSRSTSRS